MKLWDLKSGRANKIMGFKKQQNLLPYKSQGQVVAKGTNEKSAIISAWSQCLSPGKNPTVWWHIWGGTPSLAGCSSSGTRIGCTPLSSCPGGHLMELQMSMVEILKLLCMILKQVYKCQYYSVQWFSSISQIPHLRVHFYWYTIILMCQTFSIHSDTW